MIDTLGVGLEHVIDAALEDKVVTGIAKSGVTCTVFCVNEELQPDAVFVTTTVNTPLPLAIGLDKLALFKEPVPGAVQLYVTPVDGVAAALIVMVGFAQVVVTDGAAILTTGIVVFEGTVTLALPTQPLMVFVITTE